MAGNSNLPTPLHKKIIGTELGGIGGV